MLGVGCERPERRCPATFRSTVASGHVLPLPAQQQRGRLESASGLGRPSRPPVEHSAPWSSMCAGIGGQLCAPVDSRAHSGLAECPERYRLTAVRPGGWLTSGAFECDGRVLNMILPRCCPSPLFCCDSGMIAGPRLKQSWPAPLPPNNHGLLNGYLDPVITSITDSLGGLSRCYCSFIVAIVATLWKRRRSPRLLVLLSGSLSLAIC